MDDDEGKNTGSPNGHSTFANHQLSAQRNPLLDPDAVAVIVCSAKRLGVRARNRLALPQQAYAVLVAPDVTALDGKRARLA